MNVVATDAALLYGCDSDVTPAWDFHTVNDASLSKLVGLAYEAGVDPGKWPTFLEELVGFTNARSAALAYQPDRKVPLSFVDIHGVEPHWLDQHADYYSSIDGTIETLIAIGSRTMVSDTAFANRKAFLSSVGHEVCNDWLRPQGIHHCAAVLLDAGNPYGSAFTIQRFARQGPFTESDLRDIDLLIPHIRRAQTLGRQLASLRARALSWHETLERINMGALLCDERGRVHYANPVVEDLMRARPSFTLTRDGLVCARPRDTHRLRRLIKAAARTGRGETLDTAGACLRFDCEGASPLQVLVSPLQTRCDSALRFPEEVCVLILLKAPGPVTPPGDMLASLYGLTRAEAEVATDLANGHSLKEISDARQRSIHTVRTQLKTVLRKTSTSSQVELVTALHTIPTWFR